MKRHLHWVALVLVVVATLAGCAGLNTVTSDVSSYGQWPSSRAPGSYVFERLPSQQAQADEQARLEDAARPALEHAAFSQVADAANAEYSVQIAARVMRYESIAYDGPFFWHGGFLYGP